jgi:amino acid adenylation domain-containing protein
MEELPYYMAPAATRQIDSIPLNQNGKVDKKKLPEPKFVSEANEEESTRPLTYLEQALTGIVGEIVGHKDFGINLNLMRAGLTSLSAIKLATTIQKEFGYAPAVKRMMQGITILELENEIQKYLLAKTKLPAQEAEKTGPDLIQPENEYSLSPAQMGIYYDYVKRPQEIIYNIPVMLRMSGNVNPERLIRTLEAVVNAHPFLQTRLKMDGGEVKQFRPDGVAVKINHIKMEDKGISLFKKEFPRPFDILQEQLYRMTVVETEENVYLFADFQHIIFDGASLRLFLQELRKTYDGEELIEEQYTYYTYVKDEIEKENTPLYKEAEEYFAARFKNFEGTSEIPADLNGKIEDGKLAEAVYFMDKNRIDSYCSEKGITPAHLFLGGTAYTISRFAGSRDIHICTISNGRSDLNLQNSLGMFVRTLPLSVEIDGDLTGVEFIKKAKDVFLKAIAYEDYPFTKIAAQYGFAPQIMYACQLGVLDEKIVLEGEELQIEEIVPQVPKFKISVHIEERDGRIGVCVQYNTALYTGETMEIFAESLGTAVKNIIDNPEKLIKHTSIVSKKQAEILAGFNREAGAEIEEKILHRVFEKQAAQYADRKALIAADGEFTFSELNNLMNRTANGLIRLGACPGEKIAILLPRDSRMIIAMYGVLKAGCAYIPCDTEYPVDRVKHIIEDSDASRVLTTQERMKDFPGDKVVDIDTLISCPDASAPQVEVKPGDLAYLIYTSGSTGKPKGVMLEHHGICNYVYNHPANKHVQATVEEASAMLSVTTVSFDMSLKETALALCNGITLVLANEEEARNPVLLARLFAETKADAFNATPSRMLEYMELPAFCEALQNCKVIMAGGEKYPLKLLDKLQGITKARLFNTYGPTEITVSSNGKELTRESSISIGRPLLNCVEYIVDQDGNELPPGVTGELYIGGPGVARGYQKLDSLTKEMFVEYQGNRVYKSGDYAKWSAQGDVLLLGRKDNQIKLRGLRIELGEIESKITRYQHIGNAVAMIRKFNGAEQLCAYYTGDKLIDVENLRESLKKELPNYMVPTAYMQLEALPVTPNGKTDLKALPDPLLTAVDDYEEPTTKTEKVFCDIFAKVLELPRIGAVDNFFDKGGTSLVVTRVIIEAAKYDFEITYGDVFAYPTPRELAKVLSNDEDKQKEFRDPSLEDLAKYDYSKINNILRENNLDQFKKGEKISLGNILLTGATGFLGVHVLEEFLRTQKGVVYCLLRDGRSVSAVKRLKIMLYYYFENSYEELFGKRIIVLEGDITKPESFIPIENLPVDTVINCAANVKHFSQGTDIEDVNVGGVLNIIDYCLKTSARLVHVSTTSVSGFSIDDSPAPEITMNEQMLYFGQNLDTKYGHSKFRAERYILEKMPFGLKAKIMRVGNLSARDSDGEFQINFTTNSFMGRLKSYLLIGKFPYQLMNQQVEFSPIEHTAASILLLAETPEKCCVFHNYNNHTIAMGDIIRQMNKIGLSIEITEMEEYEEALKKAEADPGKAKILSSMIAYRNMGHGRKIRSIPRRNEYSLQSLYRLGYQWPITSQGYMDKFLLSLQGLGYFGLN